MMIECLPNCLLVTCLKFANCLDQKLFMSNDDKARVPLGLTAASLQAPLLMRMEYKVKLMDHDFVVGPQHKLIPLVYGICEVTIMEMYLIVEVENF